MTTATKTRKAQATIIVLATYIIASLNRVCFTVRSSDGAATYNTCFTDGHGACTCDGNAVWHRECKHIKFLAPIAAEKLVQQQQKVQPALQNCDDSYETWKRENGLDDKLSRDAYIQEFSIY